MKLTKIMILGLGVVALSSTFFSCDKETPQIAPIQTGMSNVANVQVFSATLKATRNYVYIDGTPVSGATLSYGGVFPATAYSFIVTPGSRAVIIKDTLPAATQVPITFSQSFDAGKSYTVFTYDTITSAKQVTVENTITVPTDTSSMLRFGNFIYNPTAVASVDVYSLKKISGTPTFVPTAVLNNVNILAPSFTGSTPIFTNVATNAVTPFIPYASGLTDTLYVFATGTTTPLLAKGVVSSATPTRSYTSVYNGSYRGNLAARPVTTFLTY
ncbi:hypothetical protein [Ferruginibacter sp.]